MKKRRRSGFMGRKLRWAPAMVMLLLGVVLLHSEVLAARVTVVDQNNQPVRGFRWMIEEDTSRAVRPGVYQPPQDTVRLSPYRSYSPVVRSGRSRTNTVNVTVPRGKRYFLSVLPDSGHGIGGALIEPGQRRATVTVQKHPFPTAQITVKVFHDIRPINNAPDTAEVGIPGFRILMFDQLGQAAFDAFGNPLGTTYQRDASGNFVLDAEGNPVVETLGSDLYSDANGEVTIKNLAPGKYGVRVVPRPTTLNVNGVPTTFNDPKVWSQTATIEGSPTVDAWVRADEPPALVEFGRAFWHIFIGFVNQGFNELGAIPNPAGTTGTIVGNIRNVHQSRPPAANLNEGVPVPEAWIGLNVIEGGLAGKGVYGAPADPATGAFSIAGVPPGSYQLVVWDTPVDQIFGFQTVIVPETGGTVDMGNVLVNAWFGRLEGSVFVDDGGGDPSKADNGFRDPGEIGIPGQAVNLRFRDGRMYQATTTGADGSYSLNEIFPWFRWIVAEVDYLRYKATGNTVVVDDGGVIPPDDGWNMPSDDVRNPQPQAGINPNTGNNLSRTEVGPTLLEAMIVYADQNHRIDWGKHIYQPGENGGIAGIVFYDTTRAEDVAEENVGDPWQPGIPNVRVNLYRVDAVNEATGRPTRLTLVNSTTTDSWDDNLPTDCLGEQQVDLLGNPIDKCSETLRTWNQVRPGVFDGGYFFENHYPGGIRSRRVRGGTLPVFDRNGNVVPVVPGQQPETLTTGQWVVEVVPPTGYKVVKEEDKNVDFGDRYAPSPRALLPPCVGADHRVPAELSLFPGVPVREDLAGTLRPLCDRKLVDVVQDRNTAADFFLFTDVPKAAKFHGMITNDLTNTFNRADPNFAEKLSPKWVPLSLRDYQGNVVTRTYSDQWGGYHVMVPSSYTVNPPIPTGVSPSMMQVCLNDPGPDLARPDPFYNPAYGFVCYNFDAWPGSTTNLDTPVLPVGAFTGAFENQLDCELPNGTPRISQVVGGPYVAAPGQSITIQAVGSVAVQNPDFDITKPVSPTNSPTLVRDYGFGSRGQVTVNGVPLVITAWNSTQIRATVPAGVTTGQLVVTRGDNLLSSVVGITLTVGGPAPIRVPGNFPTIQAAVDNAPNDSLILVGPGVYTENVVVYKRLNLQGAGEGSTFINGLDFTLNNEQAWIDLVQALVDANLVDLVDGQRPDFLLDRGAAITVLAKNGEFTQGRIDGFTLTQSVIGGGVFVSGYADGLQISNNRISSNSGNFGGGIRVGWPANPAAGVEVNASVDNLVIRNNHLNQNGGTDGAGGIALFAGANNYLVEDNFICGNLSGWQGAGIGHQGKSDGAIRENRILFNEVTTGDKPIRGVRGGQGGGILIAGEETPPEPTNPTPGSGNVVIEGNLIQGNAAGHDGGGIALAQVSGRDVAENPSTPANWYLIQITGNTIVNNVAGMAGGGISMGDAARVSIVGNTIAHNDSTATNRAAFLDITNPNLSTAQVAGIVSRAHSAILAAAFGPGFEQTFPNPQLEDCIIWNNRSFFWDGNADGGLGDLLPGDPAILDLGVTGTAGALNPVDCILTGGTDPQFAAPYFNELFAAGAGGEGGNFVSFVFKPLKQFGDYRALGLQP